MDHVRQPHDHLSHRRRGGRAILCVSLRLKDMAVRVGGMYDPSGGGMNRV